MESDTSKLIVNFGLRYDRTFLPRLGTVSQSNVYVGNMDFNRRAYILQAVPPACSSTVAAPCIPGGSLPDHVLVSSSGKVVNDSTLNFQPRLGLAYRLTDRTVIRSAFGIFFDDWPEPNRWRKIFRAPGLRFSNSWRRT